MHSVLRTETLKLSPPGFVCLRSTGKCCTRRMPLGVCADHVQQGGVVPGPVDCGRRELFLSSVRMWVAPLFADVACEASACVW